MIALFIGLVMLAAIGYYVSRPLLQTKPAATVDGADALSLETQRDTLYTQIKELDLDHATGKINDDDYARIRADLVAQAAEVLKQIDGVLQPPATAPLAAAARADDALEAQIAARRKVRTPAVDSDVEAAIASRRKTAPKPIAATLTCPQCGKPITTDDAFCSKCGTALQSQAAR